MKTLQFLSLAFLSLLIGGASGCNPGKQGRNTTVESNSDEAEERRGGFATPDAAFDAMISAIRTDDIKAYQECWSKNPLEKRDIEWMFQVYDKATSPEAIEASWKKLFRQLREDLWAEGTYKRFSAEVEGDKASITCAHTSQRYARYQYRKMDGNWYLTIHVVLSKKKVDAKYLWKHGAEH